MATVQSDAQLRAILAAYGGIFVAGSLAWGTAVDGSVPTGSTLGAGLCLLGVVTIKCAFR